MGSTCSLRDELDFRSISYWFVFVIAMMYGIVVIKSTCFRAFTLCLIQAVTFVGSLYVWKLEHHITGKNLTRDHATIIKRRFVSVSFASFISVLILIIFKHLTNDQVSVCESLGISLNGAIPSILLPLLLTMFLFSGPILLNISDGICSLYLDFRYWKCNFQNFLWLRNHIMAPLTEEFTYRACMIPILIPCFGVKWVVLICPLYFGIAHLHHMAERLHQGVSFHDAALSTIFQFGYTTIFGIYSAFLFVRTGNFLAPVVAHTFCNHMGFPNFSDLLAHKQPLRTVFALVYILGLVVWYFLLFPLTDPSLYTNRLWIWDEDMRSNTVL